MFYEAATSSSLMKKNKDKKINFGFPIGSIMDDTINLFKEAGYNIKFHPEIEKVEISDPDIACVPLRPIAIALFTQKGILDAGISTCASLSEAGINPKELLILKDDRYIAGKTKIVLAVLEDSKIKSIKDLRGKRIITRVPNITKKFLKKNKISAEVIFSDTMVNESKVGNMADAIVEFSASGNILRAYKLKVLETILESSLVFIANKKALQNKWKKEKIKNLIKIFKGGLTQRFSELMFREPDLTGIDEMDFKILKILSDNGRESFVEIAKEVGLSSVGVQQRVEKLIKRDILAIRGCFNIEKFYSISAHIMVQGSNEAVSWLVRKLQKSPVVYQLVKISGKYNLSIGILAPNLKRVDEFISKEILGEPGVKHIEVNVGELPTIPKTWNPPIF